MTTIGSGIQRTSARPMKIFVDSQNEVWFCDEESEGGEGFAAQGCYPASANPQND